MADDGLDLWVNLGADTTSLDSGLADAVSKAAAAGDSIAAAFNQAPDLSGFESGLAAAASSMDAASAAAANATKPLNDVDQAIEALTQSSGVAGGVGGIGALPPSLNQIPPAAENAANSLNEVSRALVALAAALAFADAIKDFAEEALTAFASLEKGTIALTALTGSAEKANEEISGLRDLAISEGLSFPSLLTANQRMTAIGVEAAEIPALLRAAADASAAMNSSFDTAANAMDRMVAGGSILPRSISALGITMQNVADTMGVAADQVTKLFKAMDEDSRVDVLIETLGKLKGTASDVAQSLTGQWNTLKEEWRQVMSDIGAALAPVAEQMIQWAESIISVIEKLITEFKNLSPGMQEFAIAAVAALVAAVPLIAAMGAFGIALSGLATAGVALLPIVEILGAIAAAVALIKFTGLENDAISLADAIKRNFSGIAGLFSDWAKEANVVTAAMGLLWAELDKETFGVLGKIQQLIDYLPSLGVSFKSMVVSMTGPLGVLDGILKDLTSMVEMLGGSYGSMATTVKGSNEIITNSNKAVSDSANKLATDAMNAGVVTGSSLRQAAIQAGVLAAQAALADKAVAKWNQTWETGARKALYGLNAMENGTKTAESEITELGNVIETANLHWNNMSTASRAMYTQLIDGLKEANAAAAQGKVNEYLNSVTDSAVKLQVEAATLADKVPTDIQDMLAGVAQGVNFTGLENQLKSAVSKMESDLSTIPAALQATVGVGLQQTIASTKDAVANISQMAGALKLIGADTSMEKLAQQINDLSAQQAKGALTTGQWNAGMNTVATTLQSKVLPAMQQGVAVSPQLIAALTALGGSWAVAGADAAKGSAGIDAFTEDLAVRAESIRVQTLSINNALKDLGVVGIQAAADAFRRSGNDINTALQGIATNATLVGPELIQDSNAIISFATNATAEMQKTGLSFDQLAQKAGLDATTLLNNIAKVAPGLAAALTAGLDPANAALALFKTQVTDSLSSADAAFTTFGQKSGDALQNILQHENDMYSKLVQMGAPLQTQLAALQQINATQQQIATATDKTGQSELQLAVNATALQLQVANLHTQTNGLADAWTQMTKAVSTAWNDLGKGIADAAVSGQNFGQAMTNVFEQLKKSIAEVVVQYLQKQLIKSLTDAGKSLDDLGGLFKTTTQVAADATHSIGGSVAAASADMSKSAEDTAFSLGSMGDEADASFSTATAAATGFGATTTTTMTTTAAVVTATGATMIATFTLLAAAVGAIAAIVGAIEQGHANTILGRIEENTRRTDLTVEGSAVYWMNASNKLDGILSTIWSPVVTLLNNISGNGDLTLNHLQDISTDIKTLVALGGMGGGGGGGGGGTAASVAALLVEIEQLQQQVGLLTVQGSSVSSIMGAVNDALTTQLGIQQNIVASDQAQLDFITSQYKLGKATQEEVNTAADQLKAAQDALNSIVTTAQNGGMANTLNAIAQGPSGSTGSDIYAGMSATDTSSTAYAPSVTEALLESMTVNIAAILQLLINQFKVNAGELYATAIEESMAGALNLPTDVINKVASGIPQLVATLNGTTTDTTTATGAAVAATSGLTGATTGLTTAVTGATGAVSALNDTLQLATTGGPNVPTVPGGSSTLTGDTFGGNFSAGVDAFIAGLQAAGPFQLPGDTFSLPPMPGANLPTSSGTASGGGGLTIVLQNQGTVVGQGGMQALADTVGSTIIQRLSSIGIRATR